MRLIDADALEKRKFTTSECNGFGEGNAYRQGWNDAMDAVMENEITIEPEPERGFWYPIQRGEQGYSAGDFRCSICGQPNHCSHVTKYCCSCGAKMER